MTRRLLEWAAACLDRRLEDCRIALRSNHGHRDPRYRLAHLLIASADEAMSEADEGLILSYAPREEGRVHLRALHDATMDAATRCPDMVPAAPRWHEVPSASLLPCLPHPSLKASFFEELAQGRASSREAREDALRLAQASWLLLPRTEEPPNPSDLATHLDAICLPLVEAARKGAPSAEGAETFEKEIRHRLHPDRLPPMRAHGLLHGDFRFANLLVPPSEDGLPPALKLIDWEFAGNSPLLFLDPIHFVLDLTSSLTRTLAPEAPVPRRLFDLALDPMLVEWLAPWIDVPMEPRLLAELVAVHGAWVAARRLRLFPHEDPVLAIRELMEAWKGLDDWCKAAPRSPKAPWSRWLLARTEEEKRQRQLRIDRLRAEENRADMHRSGHDDATRRLGEVLQERDELTEALARLSAGHDELGDERDRLLVARDDLDEALATETKALQRSEEALFLLRHAYCRAIGVSEGNAARLDAGILQAIEEALHPHRGDLNYLSTLRAHVDVERYRDWFAELALHRPIEGARVLVLGCGSGPELAMLAELGAETLVGMDLDPTLLALVRLRAERRGGAVHGDGERLPFARESVDLVILSHVLEHVREPARVLAEAWSTVAPGGLLYLEVPNRWAWREQHTGIPLVAWLPAGLREASCRLLASTWGARNPAFRRLVMGMVGDFHAFDRRALKALVSSLSPPPNEVLFEGRQGHERAAKSSFPPRITAWRLYLRRR